MTRWEAFCLTFRVVVLRQGQGRHLARTVPAPVSDDTAPLALTCNPYPQEPTP